MPINQFIQKLFYSAVQSCNISQNVFWGLVCWEKFCGYILCCFFEILCDTFHIKDSINPVAKETPLTLFRSVFPNLILLWETSCVTFIHFLWNIFWKTLSQNIEPQNSLDCLFQTFQCKQKHFLEKRFSQLTEWHLNLTCFY